MYDVCVIGSGWAGINAAITAVNNKLSVCLIEKNTLGGTCLNYGCIPTKSLVASAAHLYAANHSTEFGIDLKEIKLNFTKVLERKNKVVSRLHLGLEGLIKTKKIYLINGEAKIINKNQISVGKDIIEVKNIVIATGSRPRQLSNLKFDSKHILSSTDMLNLDKLPENILVIGGGVIGCEFAGVFSQMGSKVTISEILERILITEDREASKKMEIAFKKQGVKILTKTDFTTLNLDEFDKVLLCVGRAVNSENLGLEAAGIATDKGKIVVDKNLMTNIDSIYAAGDCIGGYQLAHVAAYEGKITVENILGKNKEPDYSAVPNCIFTHPEIASVGLSEAAAGEKGYNTKIAKFNFLALGMAHVKGEPEGFVKLLVNSENEQILGATIFGIGATELIAILALAIRNNLDVTALSETIFPHPSLSESIAETVHNFHAN